MTSKNYKERSENLRRGYQFDNDEPQDTHNEAFDEALSGPS